MKTQQQSVGMETYVTPSCKSVMLHTRQTILNGSVTGGDDSLESMIKRNDPWSWDEE